MNHGPLFYIGAHHTAYSTIRYSPQQRDKIIRFLDQLNGSDHDLLRLTVGIRQHMCGLGIIHSIITTRYYGHPSAASLSTRLLTLLRELERTP